MRSGNPATCRPSGWQSSSLVTKEGTTEPKVVLSLYEDFQCPHCAAFEKEFGPTITRLINSGAVAADYYMVVDLELARPTTTTRPGRPTPATASPTKTRAPAKDAFRRFHTALFAQQPAEGAPAPGQPRPDRDGSPGRCRPAASPDCVNAGNFSDMVDGLAKAAKINATPTVRINGEDYSSPPRTPCWPRSRRSSAMCPVSTPPPPRPRRPPRPHEPRIRSVRHRHEDPAPAGEMPPVPRPSRGRGSAQRAVGADRRDSRTGLASLTLTVEKIELLIDPSYVPSCSINPVLSCGSVMVTHQASVFGFPNPLIGIVALHRRRHHRRARGRRSSPAAMVLGGSGGRNRARRGVHRTG